MREIIENVILKHLDTTGIAAALEDMQKHSMVCTKGPLAKLCKRMAELEAALERWTRGGTDKC